MLLGAVAVHGFAFPSPLRFRTLGFTNNAPTRNVVTISCGAGMSGDGWHKDRRHNKIHFKGRPLKGGRGKENSGAMSGTSTLNAEEHVRQASDTGNELAIEMFNRFDNYRASATCTRSRKRARRKKPRRLQIALPHALLRRGSSMARARILRARAWSSGDSRSRKVPIDCCHRRLVV